MPEPRQSEPRQSEPRQSEPRQSEPRQSEPRQSEPLQSEPRQSEPRQSEGRTFRAELFCVEEPGGWWFVRIPRGHAPDSAGPFGRTPVTATVDGQTWSTSAWRDRREGWLLPVPQRLRRGLLPGDEVEVIVEQDPRRS